MVYNIIMTQFEPIATDGKVLIDKVVFDKIKGAYFKACLEMDLQQAEQDILDGKGIPGRQVLSELRAKYGYKV